MTLNPAEQNSSIANKPNVILFGTDGLNAANMSLYGYSRDTTPYINTLANSSLVSQNNFSNAGNSPGFRYCYAHWKITPQRPGFFFLQTHCME